jgi:light-regulated signal transduction histidine kinase (bacteriophytochrome)
VYLSVNSGPLYDRNGKFLAVVSAVQDVTQDIETRRSLERHASQLARSNQELDQFVHVASHDLREPLDTVHSFLALFERRYRDRLDDNGLDLVHRASEAADRMRGLIEDLRAFGRLESGAADFAPVDLGQAAAEARRNLAAAVAKTGAWIDLDDSLPVVMGRHGQLVRLFQNLFHNAIKFRSDRPPEIHVHGQPVDGGWEIVVRDNGIGFDPDRAGEIFALFRRLHTREEYEGTGLGLALCQKIAQIHGGSIRAESRPGRGADFIVFLPQAGRTHQ